jgi:hypothetical protein
VDDELWKEENNQSALQCNFIFFTSLCVKLFFPCIVNYFSSIWIRYEYTLFSLKKDFSIQIFRQQSLKVSLKEFNNRIFFKKIYI